MKVVQINATCSVGSTGKICEVISRLLTEKGIENYVLFSSGKTNYPLGIKYTSDIYIKSQALLTRLNGNYGFNSRIATKNIIRHLDCIKPDIVHLHNLHGHNVNLEMLFNYLKNKNIKTFWTFHDSWAFTGHCSYFTMVKCEQWKTDCSYCPIPKEFSWFLDKSAELYQRKKELFSGLDLTIITPSQWLADLVKQSFLKDYPVKVIHNGIDLVVFKPTESDFREKHGIKPEEFMVLGVAFGWGKRKGLDVFIELANRLDDKYKIVLVGTDDTVDQQLPDNVISIHRTQNQKELAKIYTAADVFVNPTREDNYPTVNMEAIACGTPVLTFRTGGSPECIDDTCGSVVDVDDVEALECQIKYICETQPFKKEDCIKLAKEFDMNDRLREYLVLYEKIK